ncbi:hypothetical protein D1872_240940 [compost metagenome]
MKFSQRLIRHLIMPNIFRAIRQIGPVRPYRAGYQREGTLLPIGIKLSPYILLRLSGQLDCLLDQCKRVLLCEPFLTEALDTRLIAGGNRTISASAKVFSVYLIYDLRLL